MSLKQLNINVFLLQRATSEESGKIIRNRFRYAAIDFESDISNYQWTQNVKSTFGHYTKRYQIEN